MSADKPNSKMRDFFHGRLDLEQQRKRAKELLSSLRKGDSSARTRFVRYHPQGKHFQNRPSKLSDAQLIVARENGFPSWPRMKIHIEKIRLVSKQIEGGTVPALDDLSTCHIRCGSDIRHGLKIAGFKGAFLEFADPFCQGPVLDLPLKDFIRKRAAFIANSYQLSARDALARMEKEYDRLSQIGDYSHIVLWFEHDSYDQLILAFILSFLSEIVVAEKLEIICVDNVPGVPHFKGLGQLSPELLIWLWQNRREPVTAGHFSVGAKVWKALCSPDPSNLAELSHDETDPVPTMGKALRRFLQELPSSVNHLGKTQQYVLELLNSDGPMSGRDLFRKFMAEKEIEPHLGLGDAMFWYVLEDMTHTSEPVFQATPKTADQNWPTRMLSITNTGRQILTGERRFFPLYQGTRWFGGVQLKPNTVFPCWDEATGTIRYE